METHTNSLKSLINLSIRPRRNRKTEAIRSLVRENHLHLSDLIAPFFLIEGEKKSEPILTLPDVHRLSLDFVLKKTSELHKKGIQAIALFPVIHPYQKCPLGKEALNEHSHLLKCISTIKKEIPSICVITDIALDPYTSHGHDGLVGINHEILNDETLDVLAKMALLHAQAGSDFVAPSDMMDGRIGYIRKYLDQHGYTQTGIIAYSAKYCSSLYGPFRDALGSNLSFGDKKSYQLDPSNSKEALLEALLDEKEGADIIMIKPALFYLDIIAKIKEKVLRPVAAYHVSGEYAMIMAAAKAGYIDQKKGMMEALLSIKRAGADLIFTYAIEQVLSELSYP